MFSFLRLSPLHGYALSLLCAGAFVARTSAQVVVSVPPASAGESLPRADSPWFHGGTLRTVLGYTDNVLWSAVTPQGRGFAQAELEAFVFGARPERWEAKALISGETRRYLSALEEAAGEQSWLGRGELAVFPLKRVRVSVVPQAFSMDQVYDLSADRDRPFVAKMRVRGGGVGAHARVGLPRGWEIEPMAQRRVADYRDFAEDYAENKFGARLRWRASERLQAGAAFHQNRRTYRERVNYTEGGRALLDARLRFDQRGAELNLFRSWSWHGTVSLSPALEYLENRDGASGFFDYDLRRGRVDLSWEGRRWLAQLESSAGRYDYRVQTVGMGLAPPKRLREDFTTAFAVEYTLRGAWKLVARYAWERARTNEINSSYRINTVSSGVAWSY